MEMFNILVCIMHHGYKIRSNNEWVWGHLLVCHCDWVARMAMITRWVVSHLREAHPFIQGVFLESSTRTGEPWVMLSSQKTMSRWIYEWRNEMSQEGCRGTLA